MHRHSPQKMGILEDLRIQNLHYVELPSMAPHTCLKAVRSSLTRYCTPRLPGSQKHPCRIRSLKAPPGMPAVPGLMEKNGEVWLFPPGPD